jgi:hypothetical protein
VLVSQFQVINDTRAPGTEIVVPLLLFFLVFLTPYRNLFKAAELAGEYGGVRAVLVGHVRGGPSSRSRGHLAVWAEQLSGMVGSCIAACLAGLSCGSLLDPRASAAARPALKKARRIMSRQQPFDKIRALIENDQVEEALEELRPLVATCESPVRDELVLHFSRRANLRQRERRGVITGERAAVEANQRGQYHPDSVPRQPGGRPG